MKVKTTPVNDKGLLYRKPLSILKLFILHFFFAEMHNPLFVKQFICELCGNAYSRTTGLKQHMVSVHSTQRDFPCTECGKAFTNKNRLANHLRIHTGAKPFKCKVCDYRSNRRDNVLLHCKKVHKVEKPTYMTCVETFDDEL